MRKLLYLLPILFFSGCDTVDEKYLYDASDEDEYAELLELAAQECIDESTIFDELEAAGDFSNSGQLNKIYKITQDANSLRTVYVKITNVTATEITMIMDDAADTYDKIITFTKTNHDALMTLFKTMSCNPTYEDNFSAGGLTDDDSMTLSWSKETIKTEDDDDDADNDPEAYFRRVDKYTIDEDYPLFFFFFNATKETKYIAQDGDEEQTVTSKLTIEDYTDNEACDEDSNSDDENCKFNSLDSSSFPQCDVVVDTNAFNLTGFEDEIISYSAVSGTCPDPIFPSAVF